MALMFKVKAFCGQRIMIDWRMEHLPRVGDVMRFDTGDIYAVVSVCWCMDEPCREGQRINIGLEEETDG